LAAATPAAVEGLEEELPEWSSVEAEFEAELEQADRSARDPSASSAAADRDLTFTRNIEIPSSPWRHADHRSTWIDN
jgi:hypothetical protein